MANQVRLIIIKGPYKGKRFEFENDTVIRFGRASDCDVRFEDDKRMSRYHCELEIDPPHIQMYDLGSLHGTIVNKKKYGGRTGGQVKKTSPKRQHPPLVLQHGDKIQVGRNIIEVEIELDQPSFVDADHDAPTLFDQVPDQTVVPGNSPVVQSTHEARKAGEQRRSVPQPAIQPRHQAYDPNKTIVEPSPLRNAHIDNNAKTIVESSAARPAAIHSAKTIVEPPPARRPHANNYAKTIVEKPTRQRPLQNQSKTVVEGSSARQRPSQNQAKTVVVNSPRQRSSQNQAKTVVAKPSARQSPRRQAKTVVEQNNQQRAQNLGKTIIESNPRPARQNVIPVNKALDKTVVVASSNQKQAAKPVPSTPNRLVLTPEQQEARSSLLELLKDLGLKALNRDQTLSYYVIEKRLGRGGFGKVFQARHRQTQERVALKIMRPRAAVNEYVRESFKREIDNTRALFHPNIVQLLEDGSVGNMFYFTMEYCDKGNANQLRRKWGGKIPLIEALPIMKQVLRGLSFIHEQGYIHRDLKPDNILLTNTSNGVVAKIADLGLTKGFLETGMNGGLTITGIRIGTGPYMSREQLINFKYVEPVSDVWSLGATFYVMLTGKRPRQGPPNLKNHDLVLNGRIIPIRRFEPSIPLGVANIIDRSLVVDTNKRYETATEMLKALERVT